MLRGGSKLRDVGAIQEQLEAAVFNTLRLENSNSRSCTIGYLLGFALKGARGGRAGGPAGCS